MSRLHVRPQADRGKVISITPQSAGWRHVGFEVHELSSGQTAALPTGEREVCLVLVSGKAKVTVGGKGFGLLGERMTPFEGKPHAVYVPGGVDWRVEAATDLTLAICSAPSSGGKHPARHIAPRDMSQETRGKGTNVRHVTNILPEDAPADSLLVVEVLTPGGHTSSYPPHKHDQDNLPAESALEETYYHRLNPPQGFAFQRVYTDDRSLDEAIVVEDGSVVMVPRGYHPVAAVHGYELYYLNVMAGPQRHWVFRDDPAHEWMLDTRT